MLKNYLLVAWRILIKNKMYSAINIAGLAIGFACCVALGLYIYDEWNYDRFHGQKDNIYRLVTRQVQTGGSFDVAVTPGPLAPALKDEYPEIVQTCRIGRQRNGILEYKEKIVEPSKILMVDNSFFSLFDFKLIRGNAATVLLQPEEAVISEHLADQYFGKDWRTTDILLGRTIKFNKDQLLTLTGVIQDPPANSHIQYDFLMSWRYDEKFSRHVNWNSNNYHTYILVKPGTSISQLKDKLLNYFPNKNKGDKETKIYLQSLLDIHLHSNFAFHTDWSKTSSMIYIRIFLAVGLIVLLIALFNFINLSTAKAVMRMREVGVRKTIGAGRHQLLFQFFGESLMLAFIAILFAFGLLQGFLPILNSIAAKSLSIPYTLNFLLVLVGFTLLSGLLAGIYPAVYLLGFRPVKVLKGIFDLHSGRLFRQVLVVSQFTLSLILVIGTIVIYRQLNFLQSKDLGFDQAQLLNLKIKTDGALQFNLIKRELLSQSSISAAAATSQTLIDVINSTGMIRWQGQAADQKLMFTSINVDADYLPTSGMQLISGRNFDAKISSDTGKAYLINETASARMGWTPEEAIGKTFSIWDKSGNIVGVIKDFHFKPLTASIEPFVFRYWPSESFQYLLLKLQPHRIQEGINTMEKIYKKFDPKTSIQYDFVNELVDNQYRTQQRSGKVVLYFSILTIFISCLGLFGLVTFSTDQKIKQIGIRKVLGASVQSIVQLLSQDFIKLVLVLAIIMAIPVSIWLMNRWLQGFAYKINMEWWMFASASGLVLTIAFLTLSFQTIKSSMANPVNSLRVE